MKLINLTPHPVVLRDNNGDDTVIDSVGRAIVVTEQGDLSYMDGVPVPIQSPSVVRQIEGLPDPEDGVLYITSLPVAAEAARQGRTDVVSPGTGPGDGCIRNEMGHIVAVTRLNRQ